MKLILFDIDGTLLWTDGAGRRAVTRALERETGISNPAADYRFDGKTDMQIVRDLLAAGDHPGANDPDKIRVVCEHYVALLEGELERSAGRVRTLPGVVELLDALEPMDDVTLGLLTGNVMDGARLKLGAVGIAFERFTVGAFGSDSAVRNELPAVAATRTEARHGFRPVGPDMVVVGDTPADVECGKTYGARTVAVATGSYGAVALSGAGADHTFQDLSDTQAVLAALA